MASIESREAASFEINVDVAIVGAGAAGLIAGLSAREAGAEHVLLLERDAVPAGSTALSAGLIPAPGTRWQREAGIDDDDALFAEDIMRKAGGEPDKALVRLVSETAGPAIFGYLGLLLSGPLPPANAWSPLTLRSGTRRRAAECGRGGGVRHSLRLDGRDAVSRRIGTHHRP